MTLKHQALCPEPNGHLSALEAEGRQLANIATQRQRGLQMTGRYADGHRFTTEWWNEWDRMIRRRPTLETNLSLQEDITQVLYILYIE